MKNNHAHNSLLALAVCVFFVTVALYGYMYLAVNSQTRRVVIAKDIQKVQKLDEKQIVELQKIFSHSEPARDKLYGLFVVKDNVVSFIESLEALGDTTGATVEITSISEVKEETENTIVGKLNAHVDAKGSWSQISKVLVLAETMQKSVQIDSVRFNNLDANAGSKGSSWSLSFNVTAHVLK